MPNASLQGLPYNQFMASNSQGCIKIIAVLCTQNLQSPVTVIVLLMIYDAQNTWFSIILIPVLTIYRRQTHRVNLQQSPYI